MNTNVVLRDFANSEYYFAKLHREIDRLNEAQNHDQTEDVKDHGINAAITAWHLPEWALRSRNSTDDVNNFRNALIRKNQNFALMHDIATQAKHFKVSSPQNPNTFEVRTSARAVYTESEQQQLNEHLQNNPDQPLYMRLTNSFQVILKIDEREALPIFEEIYEFLKSEMS